MDNPEAVGSDPQFDASGKADVPVASALPACGIIMPISGNSSHDQAHWADVRELISRAIVKAGHRPVPVWQNSTIDRISKKIIGNIFAVPVAVADISSLNPNVMFELGLRLASKKPTIVVMEEGGEIPFDIRDFHVMVYPPSLNILKMERFISDVASSIEQIIEASLGPGYVPFLEDVVIDVVRPEQREVSIGSYVVDRIQELADQVGRLGAAVRYSSGSNPNGSRVNFALSYQPRLGHSHPIVFSGPATHEEARKITDRLLQIPGVGLDIDVRAYGDKMTFSILPSVDTDPTIMSKLRRAIGAIFETVPTVQAESGW